MALKDSHHAHRRMFGQTHGEGPFDCHFCGETIDQMSGRSSMAFVVHHMNHDHSDNRPENLVAAHHRCHQQFHRRGKPVPRGEWTDEQKARVSAALKGRPRPAEVRAKISATHRKRREAMMDETIAMFERDRVAW